MTLNGGRSPTEIHARKVYEIIRSLKGPENRPVRFREVWPRLTPNSEHKNESNWKKLTTERSVALLVKQGWIQRTVDGYVDLDSVDVAFYGFRTWTDHVIAQSLSLARQQDDRTGSRDVYLRRSFELDCRGITEQLCFAAGFWSRAIDERLQQMIDRPHSRYKFGAPSGRAADLAALFAQGYFYPEAERRLANAGAGVQHEYRGVTGNARQALDALKPEISLFPLPGRIRTRTLNMIPMATWTEFGRAMSRFLRWQRGLDRQTSLSAYRRLDRGAGLVGPRKCVPTRRRRRMPG